jgi:hypothetical protein
VPGAAQRSPYQIALWPLFMTKQDRAWHKLWRDYKIGQGQLFMTKQSPIMTKQSQMIDEMVTDSCGWGRHRHAVRALMRAGTSAKRT